MEDKIKNKNSQTPKSITFVLPGFIKIPMGGVKVVNRLAELLSRRGHKIALIFPMQLSTGLLYKTKKMLISLFDNISGVEKKLYYTPAAKVNALVVKDIRTKYIPEGDFVVAVGWQTAEAVQKLPKIHGEKIYFLQSFESYFNNSKKIINTYHYPMKKIAIAQWIVDELEKIGESAFGPTGNAINRNEFFEIENHPKTIDVMMMYHPAKIKSPKFGIKVLEAMKKQNSNFEATIVAPRKPIHKIPDWINVYIRPNPEELCRLYNSSKVYFHPSIWEGWGLPPMEAMACGCSVVAVKNKGISEYLIHEQNSLLISLNTQEAVEKISKLLTNIEYRKKIIKSGQEILDNYSEERITLHFENFFLNNY
jgi:hypothetical protein